MPSIAPPSTPERRSRRRQSPEPPLSLRVLKKAKPDRTSVRETKAAALATNPDLFEELRPEIMGVVEERVFHQVLDRFGAAEPVEQGFQRLDIVLWNTPALEIGRPQHVLSCGIPLPRIAPPFLHDAGDRFLVLVVLAQDPRPGEHSLRQFLDFGAHGIGPRFRAEDADFERAARGMRERDAEVRGGELVHVDVDRAVRLGRRLPG